MHPIPPWSRSLHPPANRGEGGYATVMAVILCAAISLTCAGLLGLVMTQKKQAQKELVKEQQLEAINTAVLLASIEIIRQQGDRTFLKNLVVSTPHGNMTVQIRAEYDSRKWPLDRLLDVDPAVLGQYTSLGLDDLANRATRHIDGSDEPADDCVRSLFSSKGYADPKKELSEGVGAISGSAGHDGQVWRIRAVINSRVQERYVRFLGDASHLFAVISQNDYALALIPSCRAVKARP